MGEGDKLGARGTEGPGMEESTWFWAWRRPHHLSGWLTVMKREELEMEGGWELARVAGGWARQNLGAIQMCLPEGSSFTGFEHLDIGRCMVTVK